MGVYRYSETGEGQVVAPGDDNTGQTEHGGAACPRCEPVTGLHVARFQSCTTLKWHEQLKSSLTILTRPSVGMIAKLLVTQPEAGALCLKSTHHFETVISHRAMNDLDQFVKVLDGQSGTLERHLHRGRLDGQR